MRYCAEELASQGRTFAAAVGVLDGGVGVAVPRRCVVVAGAAGIEPTTLGLEDLGSPRPTVRIQSVTVGEPTSQSGKPPPFGHEYAPLYAPQDIRQVLFPSYSQIPGLPRRFDPGDRVQPFCGCRFASRLSLPGLLPSCENHWVMSKVPFPLNRNMYGALT